MSQNECRPIEGTPEFDTWILERAKKRAKELFNTEIPEELQDVGKGLIAGPEKFSDLMPEKTIAEDIAIDKEERRSKLKVVK